MNKYEEIRKRNLQVAKWLDNLDEYLPVEDNRVRISVKNNGEDSNYPLFAKILKNGINVVDKEAFIDEIFPQISNTKFNYDIFSGELKAVINSNNTVFEYIFIRNSLARRNEIWKELAKKGNLPVKESDYASVFSEAQIENEIKKQKMTNPNPTYANELEELKEQMHKHDFDGISGCIAGGVFDGQTWAMVNHAE